VQLANEKASAIKAKAEEEAAILLQNKRTRIRQELRNLVNERFGYMLEELERLKQQAAALQANFGNKLFELREENSPVTVGIPEKRDAAVAKIVKDSHAIAPEETGQTIGEYVQPSGPTASTEKDLELFNQLQTEAQPESGKLEWEVEILPPFDISQIREVASFLDQLPEVANTEMIAPQIDVPLVLVFLCRPINVVDVLQKIPAVAYVEEVRIDKAATKSRPRKVRISLSKDRKL
jgi:hypothetical protein